METKRICVKVKNLRKLYNDPNVNLEKWLKDPNNVYCGRSGRIFIDGNYFAYEGSKWANPFTLKKHTLDESIKLYQEYMAKKILENPEKYNLDELKGKNIGCWCNPENKCHVDVLLSCLQR